MMTNGRAALSGTEVASVVVAFTLCWFELGRHGTLALGDEAIGAVGVNLLYFQLSEFEVRGEAHRSPIIIHVLRDLVRLLKWVPKDALQHLDDVLIAVLLIVKQNNVPQPGLLGLTLSPPLGTGEDSRISHAQTIHTQTCLWLVH